MNNIEKLDDSVKTYQEQLDTEFAGKWEEIAKTMKSKNPEEQDKLFEFDDDQGKLI